MFRSRALEDAWLRGAREGTSTSPDSEHLRAAHAAALDRDARDPRYARVRCTLLRELTRWSTAQEAQERLQHHMPDLRSARIHVDRATLCAVELLGRVVGGDEGRRIGALLALERSAVDAIEVVQSSPEEGWSNEPLQPTDLRDAARLALQAQPAALLRDSAGRAWLVGVAERQGVPGQSSEAVLWSGAEAGNPSAPDALLEALATSDSAADRAHAITIVEKWMTAVDSQIAAPPPGNLFAYQVLIDRTYSVARFSKALGRGVEARELVARLRAAATTAPIFAANRIADGPVMMTDVADLAARMLAM